MAASPAISERSVEIPPARQAYVPAFLDKVKAVAAPVLVILGLAIFLSATISLGGHLFGFMAITAETVQMLFTASIMSIISGFHLAKDNPLSAEIGIGPFSLGMP